MYKVLDHFSANPELWYIAINDTNCWSRRSFCGHGDDVEPMVTAWDDGKQGFRLVQFSSDILSYSETTILMGKWQEATQQSIFRHANFLVPTLPDLKYLIRNSLAKLLATRAHGFDELGS